MRSLPDFRGGRQGILGGLFAAVLSGGCGQSNPTLPSPTATPTPTPRPVEVGCAPPSYTSGDPALDALQMHFRPTLEANRREFPGRTGEVRGFSAGALYPQIWLRDSATLFPATRYLYPRDYLESWVEEHLSHQRPDGELWDWIAPGSPGQFATNAPRVTQVFDEGAVTLSADKNTTATDQESSAVGAAFSVFRLTGDRDWLRKPIVGSTLIERLDAALRSVLTSRFDDRLGLITSALTADWGDVSPAHPDQRAIYLDEVTPVVAGVYANAFFARAADELATLHDAVGDSTRAAEWRETADFVRRQVNRHLWQEESGFYRIHEVVLSRGEKGQFDSSQLFAMGGNALAALHGVADERKAGLIFVTAEARRQQFGLSSVAGVLLPPYPDGFFAHPLLRSAFAYQNGGQWDWWAGRLLLAMFRRGYSTAAHAQLLEVGRRVGASAGLFEWYSRDGRGQGSERYAGSVGALAGAVFQGLYGLESRADGLDVTVRLGPVSGAVRICEPAIGRELAYDYRYEPETRLARLHIESNAPGTGRLAIRVTDVDAVEGMRIDGQGVSFRRESLGEDQYLSLVTDWVEHDVEIQFR